MSNPLFNLFGGNQMMNPMMQQIRQFASTLKGNPQQQVQQMLNSGRISQEQYNHAVQTANQIMRMFGGK